VVTGRFIALGKGSGVEVGLQRFDSMLTIRNEKLLRHEWFREPYKTRKATKIE